MKYIIESLKLILIYLLIKLILFLIEYFFEIEAFSSFWFTIVFFIFKILSLVLALRFFVPDVFKSFQRAFLIIFFTIFGYSAVDTVLSISLHHYLDMNYKEKLIDRQIEKEVQQNRDIEQRNNVTIQYNESASRERLLKKYSLTELLIGFIKLQPYNIILSIFISLIALKRKTEKVF